MKKAPTKESDLSALKKVASIGKDYGEQVVLATKTFRDQILADTSSPFASANSAIQGLTVGLAEAVAHAINEDDKELQDKVYADLAVVVRDLLVKHSGGDGMTIMMDVT